MYCVSTDVQEKGTGGLSLTSSNFHIESLFRILNRGGEGGFVPQYMLGPEAGGFRISPVFPLPMSAKVVFFPFGVFVRGIVPISTVPELYTLHTLFLRALPNFCSMTYFVSFWKVSLTYRHLSLHHSQVRPLFLCSPSDAHPYSQAEIF